MNWGGTKLPHGLESAAFGSMLDEQVASAPVCAVRLTELMKRVLGEGLSDSWGLMHALSWDEQITSASICRHIL